MARQLSTDEILDSVTPLYESAISNSNTNNDKQASQSDQEPGSDDVDGANTKVYHLPQHSSQEDQVGQLWVRYFPAASVCICSRITNIRQI